MVRNGKQYEPNGIQFEKKYSKQRKDVLFWAIISKKQR